MNRLARPCDVSAAGKEATRWEMDLDLDCRPGHEAFRRGDPNSTQADVCAAGEGCDGFPVTGRDMKPCMKRNSFSISVVITMRSKGSTHAGLPGFFPSYRRRVSILLSANRVRLTGDRVREVDEALG